MPKGINIIEGCSILLYMAPFVTSFLEALERKQMAGGFCPTSCHASFQWKRQLCNAFMAGRAHRVLSSGAPQKRPAQTKKGGRYNWGLYAV